MFRTWRVDCKSTLKPGENILEIHFSSSIDKGLRLQSLQHALPAPMDPEQKTSPYSRKAPYRYGWNWAPRLPGAGIWKPLFLEAWQTIRIADFQLRTDHVSAENAGLTAQLELESTTAGEGVVQVSHASSHQLISQQRVHFAPGLNLVTVKGAISKPRLWWPNGLGEQPLCHIETSIFFGGQTIDRAATK